MDSSPNSGLPIELEHFRKKQQLPFHQMHSWFTRMTGTDIAQPKLKKMLDKTMTAFRKMQSNSGKPGGATALSSFRMTPFVSSLPASHSPISIAWGQDFIPFFQQFQTTHPHL